MEERSLSRLFAEFLGTLILTFVVGCNTISDNFVWGATSNACALMVLIFAFGDVSGGHFNPAVTIAVFVAQRTSFREMMSYIFVQIVGAAIGVVCYISIFYQSFNVAPMPGFAWQQAAVAETIYTMMLCFVVLSCALSERSTSAGPGGPQFAPLAIGFVLIAGAYGAGAISGGCFNPAIALVVDASSAGLGFGWSVAYIGYELIGAALAGVFHRVTRPHVYGAQDPLIKVSGNQETRLSMLISEFLGTFILTVTVGLNVLSGSRAGAWSIGAALMCMIYSLGDVSGGHFNPAVTLAITASGRHEADIPNPSKAALYMVSQFLAGLIGAWTFAIMFGWETFSLGPIESYTWASRVPVEIFFTFVLCLTVLSVACVKVGKMQDEFFALAIGACISVGGYAVGRVSGGTLNPAVTLGVASTSSMCPHCMGFFWSFVYILLEFVGGLLAAAVFKVCRPEEYLDFATKIPDLVSSSQVSRTIPSAIVPVKAPFENTRALPRSMPLPASMMPPVHMQSSQGMPLASAPLVQMPHGMVASPQMPPQSGGFALPQTGPVQQPSAQAVPATIPTMGYTHF
jgi:aquaporin Z